MDQDIDKRLKIAKEEKELVRRLEMKLQIAREHLKEAREKNKSFQEILRKEKDDFEKLNTLSLANLFATVLGNKKEKMDQERQEYVAAKLKYEASIKAVNEMEREIDSLSRQLEPLKNAEADYLAILKEKEEFLKNEDSDKAKQLLIFAEKEGEYSAKYKEIEEAVEAAENVLPTLESLMESLNSASHWGTLDMIGGGLLTTAVKHSRIDDAKEQAALVQQQLYLLERELQDLEMVAGLNIEISGFVTFADYFFDGLIADWVVQSRIHDVRSQAEDVKIKVEILLENLKRELLEATAKLEEIHLKRQELIEKVTLS